MVSPLVRTRHGVPASPWCPHPPAVELECAAMAAEQETLEGSQVVRRPGRVAAWRVPLVILVVALIGATIIATVPERFFVHAPKARELNPYYQGVHIIRNDADKDFYFRRGSYAIQPGARPYRETFIEYPQLAAYLFAVPYFFVRQPAAYYTFFTFMMALALGGLAALMLRLGRHVGVSPSRVLLLLLPGTFYFCLNQFDVMPTLVVVGATLLLVRGQENLAFATLALGVLFKSYPLIYLPAFALRTLQTRGLKGLATASTVFGLVLAAFSIQLALWSGPEALLVPYAFQFGREDNPESLYRVVTQALPRATVPALHWLFLLLQAAPGVAVLIARPRSTTALLRWMAVGTLTFVLCSRFQSPQWVVWITPLALLASVTPRELALVVAQDVLAYVYCPLARDRFGIVGPAMQSFGFVLGVLTAVRVALLIELLRPRSGSGDTMAGTGRVSQSR